MNTDFDAQMRRLVQELADMAPRPHEWRDTSPSGEPERRGRGPLLLVAAAVTAVVATGVVALVVIASDDGKVSVNDPIITSITSDDSMPGITTTSSPTTSTEVPPEDSDGLRVSYRNPPPLYQPEPFTSVEISANEQSTALPPLAVMDDGVVVVDPEREVAIVIANDPARGTRRVPLTIVPHALVAGPGDVLYGLALSEDSQKFDVVAIALSGDEAGEVVADEEVDAYGYLELPIAPFGHGADGIVDRVRAVGTTVIGYVDPSGNPLEPAREWPDYVAQVAEGKTWDLDVERHPDAASPFIDDSGVAPTAGAGVYWTWIGANADPGTDFGSPTMPVVAVLEDGGTATWWRLPDDWEVVASDVWGTVLARWIDGNRVELAWFTPPEDPSTLPSVSTTTTTPEPEWPGNLEIDREAGAVSAPGFNDFIDEHQPAWARSAEDTARGLAPALEDPDEFDCINCFERTIDVATDDRGRIIATVTDSGLLDDSTFAVRYRLVLSVGDDGLHRFVEGTYGWQCVLGRGHQDFNLEPCT